METESFKTYGSQILQGCYATILALLEYN